jgi:hypothetical protein
MAGILKVDTIQNANADNIITQTNSTTLTIGASGDTVTLAAGATSSGFGATYNGAVNWDTTPKTTTVTAASGVGYFVDTTTTTLTVNLPVGSAGSIVAVSDYANTAATNNIIIDPNGTDKINGANENAKITTNGASVTLIYVDSTRGWKDVNDATLDLTGLPPFVAATGGTITTCGDFKIHTFTGPGTFTVTSAGTPAGSTTVDYMVIAGGGAGGGFYYGGGGGAGGFRESVPSPAAWTASPLANPGGALPVSVQGYPITVGGGGTSAGQIQGNVGTSGNNSIFSTITSAGGGRGGTSCGPGASPTATPSPGANGGSGGGAGGDGGAGPSPVGTGGVGNTPPTSPPQGSTGGIAIKAPGSGAGGGGGGATSVGGNAPTSNTAGNGGTGAGTAINPSPSVGTPGPSPSLRYYAGGGGGGVYISSNRGTGGTGGGGAGGSNSPSVAPTDGTTNTGGGGGGRGKDTTPCTGGSGGSGIVVIRYKFQ